MTCGVNETAVFGWQGMRPCCSLSRGGPPTASASRPEIARSRSLLTLLKTADLGLPTPAGVKIVLQDHGRGGRVEFSLPSPPVLSLKCKQTFRFLTGESLVLQVDRQRDSLAQAFDESEDVSRLPVGRPIQRTWQPNDNGT